jgi:hypothetical protein
MGELHLRLKYLPFELMGGHDTIRTGALIITLYRRAAAPA